MPSAFYNDSDFYVAQWLGNLVAAGHLPQGAVDARSIVEIEPAELGSFRQCHFFAGIGGWPFALQLAGWGDREVWTASCPCQPFSSAGQRRGHADERHLWPAFYRLVAECRPATIFGEQVASKDGREWLTGVRADLEALGYAVGAADLCAASAGAPHIRQRLFWVAESAGAGRCEQPGRHAGANGRSEEEPRRLRDAQRLADAGSDRRDQQPRPSGSKSRSRIGRREPDNGSGLGHAVSSRLEERSGERRDDDPERETAERAGGGAILGLGNADRTRRIGTLSWTEREARDQTRMLGTSEPSANFWSADEWLPCLDGKARRIESTIQPLANGIPNRVGLLRGAGNAVVPQVAAEFVMAFLETMGPGHA